MATLLSPDMLPEDIRNMDFGQASMPHAPEAQTPEVPYDTTTSAPDRPAIPLSPDMLSGNLRGNDSEKSGIEFSFDAFGYTQQVELVQESYADGNLAVTAYLSDPTDESFGQPWSSVTVNFGSPLQQDATVFLDTNNMVESPLVCPLLPTSVWRLEGRGGRLFVSMASFGHLHSGIHLRYRSHGQHARFKRVRIGRPQQPCRDAGRVPRGTRKRVRQRVHGCLGKRLRPERRIP